MDFKKKELLKTLDRIKEDFGNENIYSLKNIVKLKNLLDDYMNDYQYEYTKNMFLILVSCGLLDQESGDDSEKLKSKIIDSSDFIKSEYAIEIINHIRKISIDKDLQKNFSPKSKEIKKCRHCGATLLGKGKFCVECGKATEPEMTKCPRCGFEIEGKIKFCPDCGHSFAEQKANVNTGIDIESDFVLIPGKDYRMSKYEVTQELYQKVMGENPSNFKGERRLVESVSWYYAIVFCNKLSEMVGKVPVYSVNGNVDTFAWESIPTSAMAKITQNISANGYRLPTRDEWRYAARGGEKYTYAGSDNIDEVAWYEDNSGETTHDVGQKKPNGYGLYDMSGNVEEWCWDSTVFGWRNYCGGVWDSCAESCEVDHEGCTFANYKYNYIGFRLVCKA